MKTKQQLPSKIFEHPGENFVCPFCNTSADSPVVLVPIPGTEQDGIQEQKVIHVECFQLVADMLSRQQVKHTKKEKENAH